jgi:hypothetical protein
MRSFLKRNVVRRYFPLLPRHISCLLIFAFLFASIVSTGTSVFLSPTLAEAQGSEKGNLHRHHPLVREAIDVLYRHRDRLMRIPDVVGTGVGIGSDGLPVIKVFTARHDVRGIPEWLELTPVHVETTGRFYALRGETCDSTGEKLCTVAERWPLPVPTGVSVGHPAITAGTIAARVTDGTNVYVLSNNHVLANVNQASIGDPILQPGPYDGGTVYDAIANLSDFQPIAFCDVFFIWLICDQTNTIDAAIAESEPAKLGFATPLGEFGSLKGYGAPSSTLHPAYGNPGTIGDENLASLLGIGVQKYGRGSGWTTGSINTINATVDVCYDENCNNIARFTDQLIVTPGTFSAGGDSGSLVVTNDGLKQAVGLLFAGSNTQTIINRIDLVLNRFGVTIDEGIGQTPDPPAPPSGLSATAISDSQIDLTWTDDSNNEAGFKIERCTDPDCNDFTQIATVGVNVTIYSDKGLLPSTTYNYRVSAYNSGGDSDYSDVAIATTDEASAGGLVLRLLQVQARTDRWTIVDLGYNYGEEMVVVCSPNYDLSVPGPAIVRVRNASGSSFEVGLGRPWYGTFGGEDFSANVHCMVVPQGIYTVAEDGVKMEAVKLEGFASIDRAGSWVGVSRAYQNPEGYRFPVVVGQVVSQDTGIPPSYCPALLCDSEWSVFWTRGTKATNPPVSNALYVGRHSGQDPTPRPAETLMYIVIEAGSGTIDGRGYLAGLGADTVRGMQNRPPFNYSLSGLTSASVAIVSQSGMDGTDGGWPILYGPNAVDTSQLKLAIEEDWYYDSERNHTTEQVSYIVFE